MAQLNFRIRKRVEDPESGLVINIWKIESVVFNSRLDQVIFSLGGYLEEANTRPLMTKRIEMSLDPTKPPAFTAREVQDLFAVIIPAMLRHPHLGGGVPVLSLGGDNTASPLGGGEEMRLIEPKTQPEPEAPLSESGSSTALKIAGGAAAGAALVYGIMQVIS